MKRAFVVEGHMEARIVESLCKGAEVRRLRMNGVSMPIEKIADRAGAQIELLYGRVDKIYLIVDREGRDISASEMKDQLTNELRRKRSDITKLQVSIADRCMENWFLPFLDDDLVLSDVQKRVVEGRSGKSIIKEIFKRNNRNYNELVDGVRFFKALNPSAAALASASFAEFLSMIDDACWWKSGGDNRVFY